MTKEEMDYFVNDNMGKLKDIINDIPNHFPFNLANELSDQYRYCDIHKLYNVINDKLSPKHKAALILRYKYKYPYKDIEKALGYSTGYVRTVINGTIHILRTYYDIYVYDKEYITSDIKKYKDKINYLNTDIDQLKKYKDYLMDQVLKDNPNMSRSSLISKMDNAVKFMNTSINDLDLSVGPYNHLHRKYDTLYKLSCITIEDLLKLESLIGTRGIKEVVDKLYYEGIYIEHETIKNIETGQVRYISKNDMDKIDYKSWKLI